MVSVGPLRPVTSPDGCTILGDYRGLLALAFYALYSRHARIASGISR